MALRKEKNEEEERKRKVEHKKKSEEREGNISTFQGLSCGNSGPNNP